MSRARASDPVFREWGTVARLALVMACLASVVPLYAPHLSPGWHSPRIASLAAWGLLLVIEVSAYSAMTHAGLKDALRRVSWTYLPCVFLWGGVVLSPFIGGTPQDSPRLRAEIVFGVVWILHLGSFAGLWVKDSLGSGSRSLAAVFGVAACFLFAGATTHTVRCDLTGDEPHYLLMTHSLSRDGDLDLANNYAADDARVFYRRGVLQPQGNEHLLPDGRRLSHHPIAPAFLLAPGYLLGGRIGAALTVSLLAALALALTLNALWTMGFKPEAVESVGWVGLFASPFLLYGGLLFAEIPTALLVAGGLAAAARKRWGTLGVLLGLLLWAHNRNVLLVIPVLLALALAWRRARWSPREIGRLLLGCSVPALALALVYSALYGVWTPLGAHHEGLGSLFSPARFHINFPGLLLDQEAGLWFYFPVFATIPAGWILGWRRGRGLFQSACFTLAFYYLCMSFYQNLGLQPAARFLAPVTPLMLLAMAPALEALAASGAFWRRLALCLFAVSAFLNLLLAAVPWMRFNRLEGSAWVLQVAERLTGLPWARWEPAFHAPNAEWRSVVLSLFWIVGVGVLTAVFVKKRVGGGRA